MLSMKHKIEMGACVKGRLTIYTVCAKLFTVKNIASTKFAVLYIDKITAYKI